VPDRLITPQRWLHETLSGLPEPARSLIRAWRERGASNVWIWQEGLPAELERMRYHEPYMGVPHSTRLDNALFLLGRLIADLPPDARDVLERMKVRPPRTVEPEPAPEPVTLGLKPVTPEPATSKPKPTASEPAKAARPPGRLPKADLDKLLIDIKEVADKRKKDGARPESLEAEIRYFINDRRPNNPPQVSSATLRRRRKSWY
jgi:hypothetical protein